MRYTADLLVLCDDLRLKHCVSCEMDFATRGVVVVVIFNHTRYANGQELSNASLHTKRELFNTGRIAERSGNLPVLNLLRGQKSAFSPRFT